MSVPDPSENPFAGIPLFGDLARLLGGPGAGAEPWDTARQLAVSIATDGATEGNVDPTRRIAVTDLARLAAFHVGAHVGDDAPTADIVAVNRSTWATDMLSDQRTVLERLAGALTQPPPVASDAPTDPFVAMFGNLSRMLAPMLLGMTAGSMVGHLAGRALGTYHLPLPRPAGRPLQLVVPNVEGFAADWELRFDDVALWVCLSELTHHSVLGRPHVGARLADLLERYVGAFRPDATALEEAFGTIDPMALGDAEAMRSLLGDPAVLLGATRSPEQDSIVPHLDALVATIAGWVDHTMDTLTTRVLGGGRLGEALRRRRVEVSEADRFVERLLGLQLSEDTYRRGSAFVAGVIERAGDDALGRLWVDEASLPTPAEVDAPGLWLARLEFE